MKTVFLVAFAALSILFFSYHLAYAQKIIPGVKVSGAVLGNKNRSEAETTLRAAFNQQRARNVRLAADGKTFDFPPEELGIDYNLSKTMAEAFAVGRSGNLFADLRTEVRTWFNGAEIEPALAVDNQKLSFSVSKVAEEIDDPPQNSFFILEDDRLDVTVEHSGRRVNQNDLRAMILFSQRSFSGETINIPVENIDPEITAANLESVKARVENLLSKSITLTYQGRVWLPTKSDILTFLKFKKESDVVKIESDTDVLTGYLASIAREINREPKGDIFRLEGDRVVEFRLASDGLVLDEGETLKLLSEALLGSTATIELPVKVSTPLRSANDYGIAHLLGQGVSDFAGSSQGRINNIKTASARLRGVLVAPGETFSFNKSLGEVSAANGYDTAWIIKEGRTVLGTGGGVCQVSTTVFRAAFNSGLEILKRTAHAYRVHYYEPPAGFDATVYEPSPDLVFKNDTGNYVLIWSYVDVSNSTLTFNIYGTSDGRSTKMIGPFVSGETPPPTPLYQEDPNLTKGTTQQIDFAAWGANAVLKREVYRNGTLLHNDTFVSNYKPWQAVYLVGTKE